MPSWSTITFVSKQFRNRDEIPNRELYEERHGTNWPQKQLAKELFSIDDRPDYITKRTGVVGGVIGLWFGNREQSEDKAVLEHVSDLIRNAVVVHANDTTDTGEAYLFQKTDDGFLVTDHYEETGNREKHVGERAASYMHAMHGIPAVARAQQTCVPYRNEEEVEQGDFI